MGKNQEKGRADKRELGGEGGVMVELQRLKPTGLDLKHHHSCLRHGSEYHSHKRPMENEQQTKEELIAEIQRKVAYFLFADDYSAEEKEVIARRFFQALEAKD